jgi:hypothetical protein
MNCRKSESKTAFAKFWKSLILFNFSFTQDLSQLYQVFPDEILGSGQFGIVYGGKEECSRKH